MTWGDRGGVLEWRTGDGVGAKESSHVNWYANYWQQRNRLLEEGAAGKFIDALQPIAQMLPIKTNRASETIILMRHGLNDKPQIAAHSNRCGPCSCKCSSM